MPKREQFNGWNNKYTFVHARNLLEHSQNLMDDFHKKNSTKSYVLIFCAPPKNIFKSYMTKTKLILDLIADSESCDIQDETKTSTNFNLIKTMIKCNEHLTNGKVHKPRYQNQTGKKSLVSSILCSMMFLMLFLCL